jgi:hypothetical protein
MAAVTAAGAPSCLAHELLTGAELEHVPPSPSPLFDSADLILPDRIKLLGDPDSGDERQSLSTHDPGADDGMSTMQGSVCDSLDLERGLEELLSETDADMFAEAGEAPSIYDLSQSLKVQRGQKKRGLQSLTCVICGKEPKAYNQSKCAHRSAVESAMQRHAKRMGAQHVETLRTLKKGPPHLMSGIAAIRGRVLRLRPRHSSATL